MNDVTRPTLLDSTQLPVPRLELRWDADDAPPEGYPQGTRACRYLIVLPLKPWDIRREDENCVQVRDVLEKELGCTIRSGGDSRLVWHDSNTVDTPFRDGQHAAWDSFTLNIPAYAVSGEYAMLIECDQS